MLAGAISQREPDFKACVSGLGTYLNISPVLFHDALDRVEAEAGSLSHAFRREKRFEDVRLNFRRDSRTVVGDLHNRAIVVAVGANSQLTLAAHRINRVVNDV